MHGSPPQSASFRAIPVAAMLVLASTATAGEAPIAMSAQQLTSARIAFARAQTVDAAAQAAGQDGASLRLAGRIVVPNTALELALADHD